MATPPSASSFDESPQGIVPQARALQVRWARPNFATFGRLALLWGFCAGIPVGIGGFVGSLFGADPDVTFVIWRFHGITAGAVGLLLCPLLFAMLGTFSIFLFPLFRLGVIAAQGPKLYLRAESDQRLALSRLQLRSYVKLSAIFGFLLALFSAILMAVVAGTTKWDDMTVAVVPFLFSVSLVQHGATTFVLLVSATPFLYGAYFAVLGIFAFIPFRLFARMFSAVLPSQEVRMCG